MLRQRSFVRSSLTKMYRGNNAASTASALRACRRFFQYRGTNTRKPWLTSCLLAYNSRCGCVRTTYQRSSSDSDRVVGIRPNTAISITKRHPESRSVKNARGQVGPKKAERMSVHSLTRLGADISRKPRRLASVGGSPEVMRDRLTARETHPMPQCRLSMPSSPPKLPSGGSSRVVAAWLNKLGASAKARQ
jgi:hypothetical protein